MIPGHLQGNILGLSFSLLHAQNIWLMLGNKGFPHLFANYCPYAIYVPRIYLNHNSIVPSPKLNYYRCMRTKTVQRRLLKLALGLIVLGITYYFREPVQQTITSAPQVTASDYTVTEVSDGDTIKVRMGDKVETVRFIGMDTPETKDPRKAVQCFGQQASEFTKNLLLNKQVRLESDPNDSDRDKYKRLLRYVYLDDELINAKLIHDGYAFAYVVFPFTKLDEFRTLEAEARANNRGLWAGCTVNDSSQVKQTNDAR